MSHLHHSGGHAHAHNDNNADTPEVVLFDQEFWDDRYRSSDKIWSGKPNVHLVSTAAALPVGSALDVGCGEGADAIWLAGQGWQVTAVDVSVVALERAAGWAADAGDEIAQRIHWQQVDAMTWDPAPQQFDLVSAQFIHLPPDELVALHRRLGAAVRPGGTLLIVGHHPSDLETSMGRPRLAHLMFTAEQVAATLDPADWSSMSAEAPQREAVDPEGQTITICDAVLRAVRRRPAD